MPGSVGVDGGFGVTKGVKDVGEGFDLLGDFGFFARVSGETEDLVNDQAGGGRFPGACDSSAYAC